MRWLGQGTFRQPWFLPLLFREFLIRLHIRVGGMLIGYSRQTPHWEPGYEYINQGASLPLKLGKHISEHHYRPDPRIPQPGNYLGVLSNPADAFIAYVS